MYSAHAQDDPQEMDEIKQLPSMFPGPAVPGCCLVSFHILWAILSTSNVQTGDLQLQGVSGFVAILINPLTLR